MTATITPSTLTTLKPGDLNELAQISANPCVTILMQTHRSGRETQQGSIRLKNLLNQASEKLEAGGHDDDLLTPLQSLPNQNEFWQHQGDGLAICITPRECRLFRLNRQVDDHVAVGQSLFVQPLICEQNATANYFVLSLSWDDAKLFRYESGSLTLVETEALPAKFNELVLPRDPEESLQNTSHRSVGNTAGTSTAVFHGQGEGEDKIKADRDQYLTLVGDEVSAAIYNTGMPLVVVATSEVTGHFEATTKVQVDAKVAGSPSEWNDEEFREHAHAAIASHIKPDHEKFGERFGTALAGDQASDDLETILTAAKNGKVESLIVCHDAHHSEQTNQAVIDTLINGGDVCQCQRESMPSNDAVAAAIFRY